MGAAARCRGSHLIRRDNAVSEDEQREKVNYMYIDMYVGRGKDNPSMTVRMDRQEQITTTIIFYARWILGVGAAILTGLVANLVKH